MDFLRSRQFLYYFISLGCQDKNRVLGLKYREQKRIKMQKERVVEMMEFEFGSQVACTIVNYTGELLEVTIEMNKLW